MKIQVQRTEEVTINNKQMEKVTLQYLEERYNLKRDMLIENGELKREVEVSAGSHSFFQEEFIRKATEEDELVLKMIHNIIS